MSYTIPLPNGQLARFPDGYPREKAQEQVEKYIKEKYPEPPPSATKQFLRSLGTAVIPTGGGAAGAAAAMAAAAPLAVASGPGAPFVQVGAGVLGALGGAQLGAKLQESAIEAMPETAKALGVDPETMARGIEANPLSARTAEILAFMLGYRVKNPLDLFRRIKPGMTEAEAKAIIRNRVEGGVGAGVGAASDLAIQSAGEEPVDWSRVAESGVLGAVLREPRSITKKMEEGIAKRIPWSEQAAQARAAKKAEAITARRKKAEERQFAPPDLEQAKARLRMEAAAESQIPPSVSGLLPSPETASTSWNVRGAKYKTREFTSPNPEDWVGQRIIGPDGKEQLVYVPRHQIGEGAPDDFRNVVRVPMRPADEAPPSVSELRAPQWYEEGQQRARARQEADQRRVYEEELQQREIARIRDEMAQMAEAEARGPRRLPAPARTPTPPGRGMPGSQIRLPFGNEQLEMPLGEPDAMPLPEEAPSLYDPNNRRQMLLDLQDQLELPLAFSRRGEQFDMFSESGEPIGPGGRLPIAPEEPITAPERNRAQLPLEGIDTPEMIEARRVVDAIETGANIAAFKLRQVGESLGLVFAKNANRGVMLKAIREKLNQPAQTLKKSLDETGGVSQLADAPPSGEGVGMPVLGASTEGAGPPKTQLGDVVPVSTRVEPDVKREGVSKTPLGKPADQDNLAQEKLIESGAPTEVANRLIQQARYMASVTNESHVLWEGPKGRLALLPESQSPPFRKGTAQEIARFTPEAVPIPPPDIRPPERIPGAKPPSGTMMIESSTPPLPAKGPRATAPADDITGVPVEARSERAAEAMRGGNLAKALYHLRSEGSDALKWLSDTLFNFRRPILDRTELVRLEAIRLSKIKGYPLTDSEIRDLKNRIMNDDSLKGFDFTDYRNDPTAAGKLIAENEEGYREVERLVPVPKRAEIDPATGNIISLGRPIEGGRRPAFIPARKAGKPRQGVAFGGASVHVEGNKGASEKDRAVIARLKSENKLAEYDPYENKFYFTEEGLNNRTMLHEMVHAATVRVIREYLGNNRAKGNLTDSQYEGIREIEAIYKGTESLLAKSHGDAYENLYEFVGHAMTDESFQLALSKLRATDIGDKVKLRKLPEGGGSYTESVSKDEGVIKRYTMWNKLARAFAKVFNLDKYARTFRKPFSPNLATDALTGDNLLLRTAHSFEDLLAVPKAGTKVEPLAARKTATVTDRSLDDIKKGLRQGTRAGGKPIKGTPYEARSKQIGWTNRVWKALSTYEGRENIVKTWQNLQVAAKRLTKDLRMAGVETDLYPRMTGATSRAEMNIAATQGIRDDLNSAVAKYISKEGITTDDYLDNIHLFSIARGEREAREALFAMNAPLKQDAAQRRDEIINELTAMEGVSDKKNIARINALRDELDVLVAKNLDPMGFTRLRQRYGPRKLSVDIDSNLYNAVGPYSKAELTRIKQFYANQMKANGKEIDEIFKHIKRLQDETIRLNKSAGYHSPQVDVFLQFYRRKNYMPFKGDPNFEDTAAIINPNSRQLSGNLSDVQDRWEGRNSDSENPYLQVLADAAKAAGRDGRKGVPEEVARLINEGHIAGEFVGRVTFNERFNGVDRAEMNRPDRIFVHKPNGDVDIWRIDDERMLEAIKGFSGETGAFWKFMNGLTSRVGAMHTKYNPSFGAYNFVRDAITNSMIVGVDFDAKTGAEYAAAITSKLLDQGIVKAFKAAALINDGKLVDLKRLAADDDFYRDLHEYTVDNAGITIYQDAFNIQTLQQKLAEDVGPSRIMSTRAQIGRYFDIWSNGFEFASRAAGYSVIKTKMIAQAEAKLGRKLTAEELVRTKFEAAQYVKNLFNFGEVGKFGREAGSLFMFLRPALTGAVRFNESFAPAFQNVNKRIARLPKSVTDVDTVMRAILNARKERNEPYRSDAVRAEARKEAEKRVAANINRYKTEFSRQQKNARMMATALLGAGMAIYTLAYLTAETDTQGRNKIAVDNMDLWQRNLRLPVHGILGKGNDYFMLPWGFGFGAFAAIGAQLAGVVIGNNTLADAAQNMIPIALDSFLPIPAPQYSPFDHPGAWFTSLMAPSIARPMIEFSMGVDSFGREIYTNRINQYADPYAGGETLPDIYSEIAETLVENTGVAVTPKTVNFFLNSYADGISRLASATYGLGVSLAGQRDVDLKQDVLLISSFVGKTSSYDAREFVALREKVEEYRGNLKIFEERPAMLDKYLKKNPNAEIVVKYYDRYVNGRLRDIRARINDISDDPNLTRQQKRDAIEELKIQRDWTMRGIIDALEAWTN